MVDGHHFHPVVGSNRSAPSLGLKNGWFALCDTCLLGCIFWVWSSRFSAQTIFDSDGFDDHSPCCGSCSSFFFAKWVIRLILLQVGFQRVSIWMRFHLMNQFFDHFFACIVFLFHCGMKQSLISVINFWKRIALVWAAIGFPVPARSGAGFSSVRIWSIFSSFGPSPSQDDFVRRARSFVYFVVQHFLRTHYHHFFKKRCWGRIEEILTQYTVFCCIFSKSACKLQLWVWSRRIATARVDAHTWDLRPPSFDIFSTSNQSWLDDGVQVVGTSNVADVLDEIVG